MIKEKRSLTLPSNEADANKSGLRGHHSDWKVQLVSEANSPKSSPELGFQTSVLQSLPHDMSKSESWRHQDRLRTPLVWPASVFSGEWAWRRSHKVTTGLASSSEAVTNWVAYRETNVNFREWISEIDIPLVYHIRMPDNRRNTSTSRRHAGGSQGHDFFTVTKIPNNRMTGRWWGG